MKAVGVDLSAQQLGKARERWPGVDGMELHQADALTYLAGNFTVFDAVYSVFGASWFSDPVLLLPVVRAGPTRTPLSSSGGTTSRMRGR
ncbi:class I SAM-dependent methyltransferase [Streptomyces cyaneofuscatus]|uniref:class I SAM-dependent methyltransferase n=1 Tax=Streptomyces cyaneofuscatus TaxID=66883 RepID=UPI002953B0AA|nr:class I SAM-dependent methyltransferase [Streptomyces cyaneofuscatus]WOP10035.1 class I SAM-dependent methyltransferase [Streptomyces cyaneofuscatus]